MLLILPICSILLGIFLIATSIGLFLQAILLTALFIKDQSKTKITFKWDFASLLCYSPPIGLALILIGIKYLP